MRARQILPAGLALLTLLTLLTMSACGSGGLRVEGAGTPVSKPSVSPMTMPTASPRLVITDGVPLAEVRRVLLASKNVDPDARKVLAECTVVERCLHAAATVDVMHSGRSQVVVTINTVDDFIFGAFLIALEPVRLVWSLKADQLEIYPSKQGDLVVESEIFRLDDEACCPSGRRIEVYRWSNGRMSRISVTEQP
jgi:hypothetical protein